MDLIKIGKFLKELRCEKNLTQEQLGEKIDFFKRKWRRDHIFDFVVTIIFIAALSIAGLVMDNGLLFAAAMLSAFVLSIIHYNRMMIYVEKNAF